MKLIRRYWAAGLILMMVAVHAAVIGYVRSRVSRLTGSQSTTVDIGNFRFQPVADLSKVYHFHLHAVVDPAHRKRGEQRLQRVRMEIVEASEQLLRQAKTDWLEDPAQIQLRDRLMQIVLRHLDDEALVQRVLITDWLELPVQTLGMTLAPTPAVVNPS